MNKKLKGKAENFSTHVINIAETGICKQGCDNGAGMSIWMLSFFAIFCCRSCIAQLLKVLLVCHGVILLSEFINFWTSIHITLFPPHLYWLFITSQQWVCLIKALSFMSNLSLFLVFHILSQLLSVVKIRFSNPSLKYIPNIIVVIL